MTTTEIELFVRSLATTGASGRVKTVLDQLETQTDRGTVDRYTVTVWGEQIRPSDAVRTTSGQHVLDSLQAFREWASDVGVRIDRFYETRTIDRSFVDETYTITILPALAMAEYEHGTLTHVTPHVDDGDVQTVQDRLDELTETTEDVADDIVESPPERSIETHPDATTDTPTDDTVEVSRGRFLQQTAFDD